MPTPTTTTETQDDAAQDVQEFEDDVTTTQDSDEGEFDREALESSVSDRLTDLFKEGGSGEEEDGESDDTDDDAAGDGDDDTDSADDVDDDEADEDAADDDEEAAAADGDAPTLPDAVRRSLYAYEWSDEQIDRNVKLLGSQFIETAHRLHDARNTQTAEWAAKGRELKSGGAEQQQAADTANASLERLDVEALKKEYGDDELIDHLAKQLNPVIDRVNNMLPEIEKARQSATSHEEESLRKQVVGFFENDSMKSYQKVYGDGKASLTEEQIINRNKTLETADALIAGAGFQGRTLSVEEALQAAHDMVSAEFKVNAARDGIKKEAKTRNRGITSRPNNRSGRKAGKQTGPLTRSKLEKRTADRLAKVFGRN